LGWTVIGLAIGLQVYTKIVIARAYFLLQYFWHAGHQSRCGMQKLDLEQFKKLVTSTGWTHECDIEIIANDDGKTYGFGKVTSKISDYEITVYEEFAFNGDDISTLESGSEGINQPFELKGFEAFDEYGKLLG
jgi:hypothetical protein